MAEYEIKFKFLLNRTVDLAGEMFFIPMTMKMVERDGHQVLEPVFDMNKVHSITLQDEEPSLKDVNDETLEGLSERTKTDLVDEAHMAAREARKHNDTLRTNLYHYTKNGTIEIVNDPFKLRAVKMGNKTVKPTELKPDVTADDIAKRPKSARTDRAPTEELAEVKPQKS